MKRFSVSELEGLLSGTTPGQWTEDHVGTVFRSTSVSGECGRKVLMVEVKDDDGKPHSDCQRKNAVLMVQARNLATELLELKKDLELVGIYLDDGAHNTACEIIRAAIAKATTKGK